VTVTHKRYSIIISFLTALNSFINSPAIFAETFNSNKSPVSHEMETVVVTAKRTPLGKSRTAENVTVYTAEDISKLPARDLSEALSYIPAVDIQFNGQFGQATAISIHGSPARQVLLMVDGIPFNTQLSGQANPTQIPIEHIERVEIIKGASSSAWGSSLGGVINVITKDTARTAQPTGSVTTSFGEFHTVKNSASFAGMIDDLEFLLSGGFLKTDGTEAQTDVKETKLFSNVRAPLGDDAALTGSFGYNEADVQYSLATSSTVTAQPYHTRYGNIVLDVDKDDYQWNLAFKYNDQEITTDINSASTDALIFSTVYSNVYNGIRFNSSRDFGDYGISVFGMDVDWHTLKSNRYLDTRKKVSMQAPYANHTFQWNNWEFIPGVRYDHNTRFGSQTSPSFGAIYHFNNDYETFLRAKASRSFNAPPLMWIYNDAPSLFVGPNPDLKAERAFVYELGLETRLFSLMAMELNLYRADVTDSIALVYDATNSVFVQRNFNKFRRQGVELLLNYQVHEVFSLYTSSAFNDNENRATGEGARNQGAARQKFIVGANYKNEDGWGINVSGYYYRWCSEASLQPNDRKPIFDMKLTKEFNALNDNFDGEVFLSIHNLTNSKYWSSISFPLPKRYFEGGFSLKF